VIENSVIGLRCIVGENVTIRNSIVMGADYWDSTAPQRPGVDARIPLGIGDGCVIQGAIVDKNCRVGAGVRIVNDSGAAELDVPGSPVVIRDGIPVVFKDSILQPGWKFGS